MAADGQQDGVLDALRDIQQTQQQLLSSLESLNGKIGSSTISAEALSGAALLPGDSKDSKPKDAEVSGDLAPIQSSFENGTAQPSSSPASRSGFTSRIVLTTYPKQLGIDPIPLDWGNSDPLQRGPVVVSRAASTIRRRNAIGAHGGSYSIYYALAVASKELNVDHRPDFTNAEPAANIGPFPQWGDKKKIVAMDPWGHLVPWTFKDIIEKQNVDMRPTIAITKAHMKLPELEESVKSGRLVPDGKVCLNELGELAVTKFAVEPVWYLPGVAERFGIDEATLRRSLFEHTGGSYPELITRGDIKVFLPPIGGLTVYCFGDPEKMSDENVRLSLRIHDECNGSDVFGSDICTCRPYLIFGIEEAVKEAQNGGSGVVIYFRKEGRALGEVTKYLVYNARKRGEDRASDYFMRTENIAGVKDMRFQALMPDILHWLGIKKIDRMLSMSNMKHDAIVGQGIPSMHGTVTDNKTKKPIVGATVDVWQASTNGLYEQQDDDQAENNLRGKFRTDENGHYGFYCLKPTPYPVPFDGPGGKILQLLDRHPFRPAHIHLIVQHDHYKPLTTQIFDSKDEYLQNDSVFAVKDSLVVDFVPLKNNPKASLGLNYPVILVPQTGA